MESQIKKKGTEKISTETQKAAINAVDNAKVAEQAKQFDAAFPVIDGSDKKLVAIGNYALVKPYGYNPYRPQATEDGIILEDPGLAMDPDTGELTQQNVEIVCGKVTHIGPECKLLRVGDDVYYRNFSALPLPFMGMGLRFVNEQQVFVAVK